MHKLLAMGLLDLDDGALRTDDGVRSLTPMEVRLLRHLAAASGPVSKDDLLEHVWGYSAAAQSRTVLVTISRLRRKIERDPTTPSHLLLVPGEGYVLRAEDVAPSEPRRTNIAADRDRFVGRHDEIVRLAAPGRLTTLLGPGGVGKSRLAHHVARTWLADGVVGGAWSVGLARTPTLDDLSTALFQATKAPVPSGDLVPATADLLAGLGSALVILDEAEVFEGSLQPALEAWLDAAPDLRILATSRERLGISGERVVRVGPLATADACDLLRDRVEAHLEPELVDDEAIGVVVDLLDGIPLALELAAEHVDVLGVAGLAAALATGASLPEGGVDRPERQRTLEATLWWSWGRLDPVNRDTHARLSVFPDAFDLAAATAVLGAPAETAIRGLLDHALIRRRAAAPGTTALLFSQLTTVRTFAAGRLAEDPSAQRATRLRYAEHYAAVGDLDVPAPERTRDRLHLRTSVDHALALKRGRLALRAAVGFTDVMISSGPFASGLAVADRVLAEVVAESHPRRRLHLQRGQLRLLAGHPDAAQADLLAVRADAAAAADLRVLASAEQALGEVRRSQGDLEGSLGHNRAALAIHESLGDLHGALLVREGIGAVFFQRGELAEALVWFEELLVEAEAAGWPLRAAAAQLNLANAACGLGDQERACDLLDQVLSAPIVSSNLRETAHLNAVWPNRLVGRPERALHHAREALRLGEESGHPITVALALGHLADVEDDATAARALLERGLATLGPGRFPTGQALLASQLAAVLGVLQQRTQADALLVRAEALARRVGRPDLSLMVTLNSGLAWSALGETHRARAALATAEEALRGQARDASAAVVVLGRLRESLGL